MTASLSLVKRGPRSSGKVPADDRSALCSPPSHPPGAMPHILVWKTLSPHSCSHLCSPGERRGALLLLPPAAEAAGRTEQPALSVRHTPELAQRQPGCPGQRVQRQREPAAAVPGEVQPQVGQPPLQPGSHCDVGPWGQGCGKASVFRNPDTLDSASLCSISYLQLELKHLHHP